MRRPTTIGAEVIDMTDPRYAPTTNDDPAEDPAEGSRDPAFTDDDEPVGGTDPRTDTDTHTAALQGAAAGGAMSGNAGYAGGLMTGSENNIGMRDIPPKSADADGDG
jgi:hypothetical protein